MPLQSGSSKAAISHNIAVERRAGKPEKQAVAIAFNKAKADMSPDKFTQLKNLLSEFLNEESNEPEHRKADAEFSPGDKVSYQMNKKERGRATIKSKSSTKKNHYYIETEKEGTILVPVTEIAADSSPRTRTRHDSHVDLAKERDQLEKQIINTSSPQKQKELRLKLTKIEDQLHGRGDADDELAKLRTKLKERLSVLARINRAGQFQSNGGLIEKEIEFLENKIHKLETQALNHQKPRGDAMSSDAKLATLGRMVHTLHKRMRMK